MTFWQLVWSDYEASLLDRPEPEPRWKSRLFAPPRLILNPSLQFALLVRMAQKGPRWLLHPIRWLQIVLFSSEMYVFRGPAAIDLGPAIRFPHPVNILIGGGTKIGAGVTIYHEVTMGGDRHWTRGKPADRSPRIGDRAVIYSKVSIQGPYTVGDDAVVGIQVVLDEDVPPGALKSRSSLRLAGEWSGEERSYWRGIEATDSS